MKFTFFTVAAVLGVVQAFERLPPAAWGTVHCGHALIDRYQGMSLFSRRFRGWRLIAAAYTAEELRAFPTPEEWSDVRKVVYQIGNDGYIIDALGICNNICVDENDQGSFCIT